MLLPPSVAVGSRDVTLVVVGADATFNVRSEIIFDGKNAPTTLIDASHVSTVLHPSTATAGSYDVWVWTDGTHDTDAAQFTFLVGPTAPPQPMTADDVLSAQLRAWGLSADPVTWAPPRWQTVIPAIRFANAGLGTQATVQGLLDSTFPLNRLLASQVCVAG